MRIYCAHDKLVPIIELKPHPDNNNRHSKEQIERLAKIIDYNGWRAPITISNLSGFITKGHARLEAAKKLGFEKVPVDYQDYGSEAEEYADITADNEIARWAELDRNAVTEKIKDFDDFDIELLGIKDFEIPEVEVLDSQCDEDEVPEVEDPITKRGDIWILGNHRLMCGDSTIIDDIQKLMNGQKADMVFTDPPYRMQVEGGINQQVGQAARKLGKAIKHLCDFDPDAFLNAVPVVFEKKMNAYIFCNKDLVPDYLKWGVEAGYSFNILFWKKPNAIPLGGSHRPDVEYLLLFRKSAIWNNGLKNASYSKCLEFGRVNEKVQTGGHPTPKPVELIDNEILISSNAKSIVVDFFGGSGSTLISCEKNNRVNYTMELDSKFCDVIINRWMNYTGRKDAILESTGQTYQEVKDGQNG